jgi:hypothetical protein
MPNDDSFFKASLISSSQLWPSVAACCSEWQLQAEGCDVGINRRGRIFAGHGPRRYFFVGFADTFFLSIVFFTPLFLGAAPAPSLYANHFHQLSDGICALLQGRLLIRRQLDFDDLLQAV